MNPSQQVATNQASTPVAAPQVAVNFSQIGSSAGVAQPVLPAFPTAAPAPAQANYQVASQPTYMPQQAPTPAPQFAQPQQFVQQPFQTAQPTQQFMQQPVQQFAPAQQFAQPQVQQFAPAQQFTQPQQFVQQPVQQFTQPVQQFAPAQQFMQQFTQPQQFMQPVQQFAPAQQFPMGQQFGEMPVVRGLTSMTKLEFQQAEPEKPKYEQITLREYQKPHYERLLQIFGRSMFAIDGSEMGTGKTYIASKIAIDRDMPIMVVCPPTIYKVWEDALNRFGVRHMIFPGGPILSYDALRGTTVNAPWHDLLIRSEQNFGSFDNPQFETVFTPTPRFTKFIDLGVLIVFDEAQELKNDSAQHKAAHALIHHVLQRGGGSRILFSSGTILDNPTQVVNFMRLVDYIRHRQLYTNTNGLEMKGIAELNQRALEVNPQHAMNFIQQHMQFPPESRETALSYVVQMFLQVLKPVLMSIMIRPKSNAMQKDIKNGFYLLDRENLDLYNSAVQSLAKSLRYNPNTGTITHQKLGMGAVTTNMLLIQKAKAPAMARVAYELLREPDENGNWRKLLLFADFNEVFDILKTFLQNFNPLELRGKTSMRKRDDVVEKFQQPNNQHRLILAHPDVGGIGISLHDRDGKFPRWLLMMSNYYAMQMLQTAGRVFREGLVGIGHVRFFYAISNEPEKSVLGALMRKGNFMGQLLQEQKQGGQIFPDQYENEIEGQTISKIGQFTVSNDQAELPPDETPTYGSGGSETPTPNATSSTST